MAVATLISRITGFLRQLALAAVLGLGVVNDSYTVANTLPAMLYEILLGGVMTSVIVPLLVRAAKEDQDRGEAYVQRLVTVAFVVLSAALKTAMLALKAVRASISFTNSVAMSTFGWTIKPCELARGEFGS